MAATRPVPVCWSGLEQQPGLSCATWGVEEPVSASAQPLCDTPCVIARRVCGTPITFGPRDDGTVWDENVLNKGGFAVEPDVYAAGPSSAWLGLAQRRSSASARSVPARRDWATALSFWLVLRA
jgi:hypothetical protein